MLRRCTAILLMLCFASFSGEALVADVHDGDATAEELQRDDDAHGGRHAATLGGDVNSAVAAVTDDEANGDRTPGKPVHTQHACHCVHAHGAADAGSPSGGMGDLSNSSAPTTRAMRMPPSLEREPRLRPPIAV